MEPAGSQATRQLVVVVLFTLLCAAIFGFLWTNSGGRVPMASQSGYTVAVDVPRVGNLVYFSDVMVAGVEVGKIRDVEERGDHARVTFQLDESVAPLHEGATVQIGAKSLIEEQFLEVTDGDGSQIPSGAVLPAGSGRGPVQLDDVLQSLDGDTREATRELLRSLGSGTDGSKEAVAGAARGLGYLGTGGHDVVEAVAAQSEDLKGLSRNAAQVLAALASRRAAMSALVSDADTIAKVTAGQRDDIEETIKALPPLLETASEASDDLEDLGEALSPVARNLTDAAPHLTRALAELPATAADLRATMPPLDAVLTRAPSTLQRVPVFAKDVDGLLPPASEVLSDFNPMLGYLARYDRELAGWFANWAQVNSTGDSQGKALRLIMVLDEQSFAGWPISTNVGILDRFGPLPDAGSLNDPTPWGNRDYPEVKREPAS